MTTDRAFQLSLTGHRAPVDYDRPPSYSGMIAEKDVLVPMRDGVKIAKPAASSRSRASTSGPA